jgi:hypothetical protein
VGPVFFYPLHLPFLFQCEGGNRRKMAGDHVIKKLQRRWWAEWPVPLESRGADTFLRRREARVRRRCPDTMRKSSAASRPARCCISRAYDLSPDPWVLWVCARSAKGTVAVLYLGSFFPFYPSSSGPGKVSPTAIVVRFSSNQLLTTVSKVSLSQISNSSARTAKISIQKSVHDWPRGL